MSQAESLSLKALRRSDLPKMLKWRNDPSVYGWCRQFEELSEQHHLDWYDSLKNGDAKMYRCDHNGECVGISGLTSIDFINRNAEFSLYIGPEHQGKGYGQAALKALCNKGFNVLNLNCIWGEAFNGNPAIHLFTKLGFKEEGRRRQFYYREGKYIDAILFSLLKEEYANGNTRADDNKLDGLVDNVAVKINKYVEDADAFIKKYSNRE